MANLFKRKSADPVGAAESKVQELRERAEALEAQHRRVSAKRDVAGEARKAALLDDDALDKIGFTIASLDAQLAGLDDAIAENQSAIGDAETALAVAVDRRDREEKAKALEAQAEVAQRAYDDYLAAAHAFAQAMQVIEDNFNSFEIGNLVARISNDVAGARNNWTASINQKAAALRRDPPPAPAPVQPPPLGELSGVKRKFTTLASPGAIGDDSPSTVSYYGGFAERT